jgi:Fasciclin domain
MKVLAPSDEAFAKYWNSNEAASNDTDHLEAVLTYHLLRGIHADVFLDIPPQFIPTLLTDSSYTNVTGGQRVEAVSSGGRVSFYSAVKSVSHLITPVRCSTLQTGKCLCATNSKLRTFYSLEG